MARYKTFLVVVFFLPFGFVSCFKSGADTNKVPATAPDLSAVKTKLPEAQGYETYLQNCRICHSESYVQNQPDFSETQWASIVSKMQKTYGAPVSDSAAKVIVQYLAAIKGKK